jgi:hypothetical protein
MKVFRSNLSFRTKAANIASIQEERGEDALLCLSTLRHGPMGVRKVGNLGLEIARLM